MSTLCTRKKKKKYNGRLLNKEFEAILSFSELVIRFYSSLFDPTGVEPTIYTFEAEHANHYTIDLNGCLSFDVILFTLYNLSCVTCAIVTPVLIKGNAYMADLHFWNLDAWTVLIGQHPTRSKWPFCPYKDIEAQTEENGVVGWNLWKWAPSHLQRGASNCCCLRQSVRVVPYGRSPFFVNLTSTSQILIKIAVLGYLVSSTYANILKYHIQGMPTNIILQVFI
jgi:hypothetical protein